MKKLLLNQLSKLTLLTLVGTTATLIGSQNEGLADSLTNNALDHQTVSEASVRSDRPIEREARIAQSVTTLSQSGTFHSNEILKSLDPSVGGENTVPEVKPTSPESSLAPIAQPDRDRPAPAADRPANPTSVKPRPTSAVNPTTKGRGKARKQGMASWYGPGFHGRRTASGERFNAGGYTAAHRYLPFGTRVRVTNARTGRSVVVRINDRGPFSRGRVIDLSTGAARAIGVFQSGVAPVILEVLGR